MGKVKIRSKMHDVSARGKVKRERIVTLDDYNKFNSHVLGLGDIGLPSKEVDAIAAVFDLSGFTHFCSLVDPHLTVPEFLNDFLDWLFNDIKKQLTDKKYKEGYKLWAEFPFLAKFLGDGVLFLWDTSNMDEERICNVVATLCDIHDRYLSNFYPNIKKVVINPPDTLRCGIARGKVFSVGNRQDYIGPCINIASRLQKLSDLTFCFSRRGLDIKTNMHDDYHHLFIEKRTDIRGIGEELVWIRADEYGKLPSNEKTLFLDP